MKDSTAQTAAVVTVGSELTDGLGLDTNSAEIARALSAAGSHVTELVSVPDDRPLLARTLARLTGAHNLVIVTGGLGPTHDDITREAASEALGKPLANDPDLLGMLESIANRHKDPEAAGQVLRQAAVLQGARVLPPTNGTAPGQVVPTPLGRLILLPGPPHEMRPMLEIALAESLARVTSRTLSCVGISESDAQVIAQRVLGVQDGLDLTVLATPGSVRVVLVDRGAGGGALDLAAERVAHALGDVCYSTAGASLAAAVLDLAAGRGLTIACAESCTGGLVSSALTEVPGASRVFAGSVIAYSNEIKQRLLGVSARDLDMFGAVSPQVASAMAEGARERLGSDVAVSITGIAGPDGGTEDKPVGLVWFGISDSHGTRACQRSLFGDRSGIRERATVTALDLLRRSISGLEVR